MSLAMPFARTLFATTSLVTTLPAAIIETVVIRLAALFLTGAGGDMALARHAAAQMLNAYNPETEDELRLAANIVCFSFQTLEALSQASAPDLPLARILRLRSGAVSLSRESIKAERRLAQLQKARHQAVPAQSEIQAKATQPAPTIEKPASPVHQAGKIATAAKAKGLTWTQAHDEHQRELRIAASIKRAVARAAAMSNVTPDHANAALDHHNQPTNQPT